MKISSSGVRIARLFALVVLVVALPSAAASAQSLADLRAAGIVGERYDGIAVVRTADASADVRALVADVNAKRQKIYAERAAEQNVPAGEVARVYAEQIFERLPAGAWFFNEWGQWRQK